MRSRVTAALLGLAVLLSVLLGAATHIVWDSFTHGGAAGVELFPVLETRLFRVSGYTAYVFSVLQHSSSIIGTAILVAWIARWYRRAPRHPLAASELSPHTRKRLLAAIAIVVVAVVVARAVTRFPDEPTLRALQPFARRLIVAGLSSLVVAVTAYAVIWHSLRRGGRL